MDNYKLSYFNMRGIAEPIRLMFAYAKVPFEDNHLEATQWAELKTTIKWGQLPFLEYNGKLLTQSHAISNFLAKKFDLFCEDPWDQARCDEVLGAVTDLRLQMKPMIVAKVFEKNAELAEGLKKELMSSTVPQFLENINAILYEVRKSDPNPKSSFIMGSEKPTAVDFHLAHYTSQWEGALDAPDLLDDFQLLKQQQEAVYNLPNVSEYIKTRPDYSI